MVEQVTVAGDYHFRLGIERKGDQVVVVGVAGVAGYVESGPIFARSATHITYW
jgi:hypothetical protein